LDDTPLPVYDCGKKCIKSAFLFHLYLPSDAFPECASKKIYLLAIVSNQSWKEVPLLEISCQTNCVNYYCTKGGERDTTAFTDFKEHSYPCLYMTTLVPTTIQLPSW
jgi:hypothetical protein